MIARSVSLDLHAADAPRDALYVRITSDLSRRLRDDLSPSLLAREYGLSLRYLQGLFAEHGATFSGWVREARLRAAFAELTDPVLDRTVTEIAQRWRFSDGAHSVDCSRPASGRLPVR